MKKNIAQLYFLLKNDKKQTTPYLSTILLAGFFIWLHFFLIRLMFNLPDYIFHPINIKSEKVSNWLNTILFFTPLLILLRIFFRKDELEQYEFDKKKSKRWVSFFILYSSLLFLIIILLIFKKGIQKGAI